MTKRRIQHLAALLGFFVLSIALTYPVVANIATALPGPNGDNWQYYWNLWWMKHVVTSPGASLFSTDYLYYPTGTSLYFSTLTILDAFWTLPIQFVSNIFTAYNVACFVAFALTGFGAYLLTRYLLERHDEYDERTSVGGWGVFAAAFVSGFIFAFSPYHMAHLTGHLNLVGTQWLPFYVLFLFKALDESRWRNVPIAGAFLALTALADWYYVMYLVVFTAVVFLYRFFTAERRGVQLAGDVVRIGGTFGIFAVLVSPMLIPMLQSAMTSAYGVHDPIQTLHHSPDLFAFFLPTPLHPLFGETASQWSGIYGAPIAEKIVFLGYLPMIVAAIGFWRFRKQNRLWLIVAVVFFLLALGPLLHVNGVNTFTPFETTVPLPYLLLYYFPFVKTSRAVARFDVIVMLSLGIMVAWGLVAIMRGAIQRRRGPISKVYLIVPVLALAIVGFEYLAVPFRTTEAEVPSVYQEIRQDPSNGAVLDIPFSLIRSRYLLYQTVHEKKIVGGYISRIPEFPFVQNTPAVQQLVTLDMQPDINTIRLGKMGESVLNYYDIRYIVVHKTLDKPDAVQKAVEMAQRIFKRPPDYEDDLAVAYRVRDGGKALFVNVGAGWHHKESTDGGPARWMADEATLEVVSSTGGRAKLKFQATAFQRPRDIELWAGDSIVARFTVQPGRSQDFDTGLFSIPAGPTEIRLKSLEPAESPQQLGAGKDPRLLSVSVSNVAVSE